MECEFGKSVKLSAEEARVLAEAAVHAEHGYRPPEAVELLESMCNLMVWDDLEEILNK